MTSENTTRLKQLTQRAFAALIAVIAAAAVAACAALGSSLSFDALTVSSVFFMTSCQSGCVTIPTAERDGVPDERPGNGIGPVRLILAGLLPLVVCPVGGLLSGFAIHQLVIPSMLLSTAALGVACRLSQSGSPRSATTTVAVIGTTAELALFRS